MWPCDGHQAWLSHWSKTALASLTRWAAIPAGAREGVRVNTVCRNECDTPMLRTGFAVRGPDPNTASINPDDPRSLCRVARPEDVAGVFLFLAPIPSLDMR
ncbi:SDR family oxidoreductase [Mesorhizobium montanum]|uniref:SDR family oxidoreductase n=1 Tax=Mesorhizobium montanum TaxID=3072323 RepID=UPI003D314A61